MNPVQHCIVFLIRGYQLLISPVKMFLFGTYGSCRFTPSCSQYFLEAVRIHGAFRGSWLGIRRICRCHPWGGCGHDPVPDAHPARTTPKSRSGTHPISRLSTRAASGWNGK